MTTLCRRPGCGGAMQEGYCEVCGLSATAPPPPAPPLASAVPRTPAAAAPPPPPPGRADDRTGPAPGAPLPHAATTRFGRGIGAGTGPSSSRRTDTEPGPGEAFHLPSLPPTDPEAAVLAEPSVPEHKRICGACEAPLRRESGFCGKCGARYSFIPSLRAGDVVGQGYEVKGPIAFGGLGWIYLALDRPLSRYVVLKGLLNSQDASAAAAAVLERQFLASVKHPNIVGIYSFVQTGSEGLIVMEYVGGQTLRELRRQRGPLPPAEALSYMHRVMPALAYLHRMGLVFCDLKPENIMLEGQEIKLIDLGGVRRVDDPESDIYGTVGYSAPEAGMGPTPAGDLFTVGRTLLVLLAHVPGFVEEFRYALPGPEDLPVFAEHTALYRLVAKATAHDPKRRFSSAEEMEEQMGGVLRETLALAGERVRPAPSRIFGADLLSLDAGSEMDPVVADPRYLPMPVMDTADPGAQAVSSALTLPDLPRRLQALRLACKQARHSTEAQLRLASALTDAGEVDEAQHLLDHAEGDGNKRWRVLWFRARLELRRYQPDRAGTLFGEVCCELPGELAPQLAVGFAAELAGNLELAGTLYDRVCRVDPSFLSAIFGLSRSLRARGNRRGAVEALGKIPPSSALYMRGRIETVRALLSSSPDAPAMDDILAAGALAETMPLEERKRAFLAKEIYRAALARLPKGPGKPQGNAALFGRPLQERHVRLGLEQAFRELARFAPESERVALIDQANRVRPRTLT